MEVEVEYVCASSSGLDVVFLLPLRDVRFELGHPPGDHVVVHVRNSLRVHIFSKLKHEVGKQSWQRQLAHHFNEGLTDANPASTQERWEAVRVASFAIWGEEERIFWVEALGDERLRLDPLFWIIAEIAHHDRDHVSFADL